jgi:four helix bundle protein
VKRFRFQDLEIWKRGTAIGLDLFAIADDFEKRKHYRSAEQLRGAALSITNNIAEGAGSASGKDFAHFLNIAKRSAFENANMILFFHQAGYISADQANLILGALEEECRMIEAFRQTLLR